MWMRFSGNGPLSADPGGQGMSGNGLTGNGPFPADPGSPHKEDEVFE